jgi:AcrR family transcriptional regulator
MYIQFDEMQAMSPRPYQSKVRTQAAGETRARIVAAAAELLGSAPHAPFSLDAVAKTAGVTRLTVYNQFGSRRALLEATFDQIASTAGLDRLGEAMTEPDPHRALALIVERFCAFWNMDQPTLLRVHAARAVDSELDEALTERNERRRRLFRAIVDRLVQRGEVKAKSAPDLVDILHVLTSLPVFADLRKGRSADKTRQLIWQIAQDAVARAAR